MTPLLCPLQSAPFEPIHMPGAVRTERQMISARIASARKWRRRRSLLRLRAALLGRRKTGRKTRRVDRGREQVGARVASGPRTA